MKTLPKEQNKLVQAIERKDWPAVRNILENEPHLNETVDHDGYTPLMHAVWSNAPDDVFENMIETATVECLEHQERFLGSTILLFLAAYARVSAMRRVLEKTNKKINTQDDDGRTPLHYCLENWRLTHEQHKEVAILNISFGASVTIKDKEGKTPLDYYDENECKGYEETTRNEKKQYLKELLEKLSTPSEILARGPDAVKAFKDTLKNGEITVVNSRLMFLGQEGSGKTSCVKAMLGKVFNKEEPSTDGIVTTKTVFQTVGEDYSIWEEQKDVDEIERTKQIREHAIATNVAKTFDFTASTSSSDRGRIAFPSTSASPLEGTSAASVSEIDPRKKSSLSPVFIRRFKEETISEDTGESTGLLHEMRVSTNQLNEMRKKVIDKLANKSSEPSDVTCIWDYAGQLEYFITHRIFITDGNSYGVVFSLVDALDKLAKRRDPKKGHFEITNLQMIIFWIRLIYEYAVLLRGSEEKPLINGIIASPTISLIGTHKDLLTGSDAEKQAKIDVVLGKILEELKGTPYERHVDREMYAVDNTTALDEGIQRLKIKVGGFMKSMARTVPINWMDFQIQVQEAGKTTLRMSLDKIAKIADQCGINEDNVIHVLNYLNDLGIILYSPTNKKLKNTVIINIHMLIGIFMKIITVVEPDDVKTAPVMIQYWRKFDEEGILAEQLVRYLWRTDLTANQDDNDVIFEDFIEIMKTFGLLFEKGSREIDRVFIVPSRMKIKTGDLQVRKDEEQMVSVYVTPKDFLPDAVYSVLVVKFLELSQEKECTADSELFQNQAKIGFDNMHYLRLGVVRISNKRSLKLEITRRTEIDENGKRKPASKPEPIACMEILHVLKRHLTDLYPAKGDVGCTLTILCPICSVSSNQGQGQRHLQNLDDCLKYDSIPCGTCSMSTAKIRLYVKAELSFSKEIRNSYALQALTTDMGTEQMRKYFMTKGKLRGKHEVGKFLSWQRKNGPLKDVDFGDEASKIFTADVDIDSFDITVLMSLIQHCFSPQGDKFWENPPDVQDKSELANLRRIQLYKESTLDCSHSNRTTDVEFEKQWKELATIFRNIGVTNEDIQKYHKLSIAQPVRGFEQENVEEIRNFQVILSAVVDVGTVTMREYFLEVANQGKTKQNKATKLDKKEVGRYLMNEKGKGSFKNVKITPEQNAKMFTPTADIDTFDISIMYLIIRNCCSIPYSFWKDPDRLPSLVHIHRYRNTKLAHSPNSKMSNKEFEIEWKKVRAMLHAAGASLNNIDKYMGLRFIN